MLKYNGYNELLQRSLVKESAAMALNIHHVTQKTREKTRSATIFPVFEGEVKEKRGKMKEEFRGFLRIGTDGYGEKCAAAETPGDPVSRGKFPSVLLRTYPFPSVHIRNRLCLLTGLSAAPYLTFVYIGVHSWFP